jgi:ATP synthase protein I
MRLVGLGVEFAVTVVLGLAAGYYLDRWLGTKPWLLMVGVVLGGVLGFYGFLRRLTPIGRG